ncbi:MAG: RNA pseudouridine synthase, partial [Bacteroidales bacterium]|nr:RNA pseudouridine synthase [Bacteroidales bacterium]
KNREIKKTYWAIIKNKPIALEDTLIHYIAKDSKKNKAIISNKLSKEAKEASLFYKIIGRSDQYTLLEIDLHTGRHHQIRAQLAKIGCPIKGDLKYGYPRSNEGGFIHLHARKISFIHPVKKESVEITAPLPKEVLWDFFRDI